jgi:aspartate kinase
MQFRQLASDISLQLYFDLFSNFYFLFMQVLSVSRSSLRSIGTVQNGWFMALIVQKFGGATVESPAKLLQIASRIYDQKKRGDQLVIVVSAMGKTTDQLLHLAHEVSPEPSLSEVDTLLNTGEMISMALLTMALKNLGCPALGLCGHQAGIETDGLFSNASIADVNCDRILEGLALGQVVVVAGFQGRTKTGELTTLGRGGSDTTALALASALDADLCEILKDVPAVFSADPRLIKEAQPLAQLSYDQLLEMTYWGAKVLQYRSVEIAKYFKTPLYVGPAHSRDLGTFIKEKPVIEDSEILALNSHETVLRVNVNERTLHEAISALKIEFDDRKITFPQLLHSEIIDGACELFVTGPRELMEAILRISVQSVSWFTVEEICSVTATCRGSTRHDVLEKVIGGLEGSGISISSLLVSAMSVTVFIEKALRNSAVHLLHGLIALPQARPQLVISNQLVHT